MSIIRILHVFGAWEVCFDLVLWHINHWELFNVKSFLYIYIKYKISKHIF